MSERVARVIHAAERLFEGDQDAARQWLSSSVRDLGEKPPIELLDTEAGAQGVLQLIGRLEHGVF